MQQSTSPIAKRVVQKCGGVDAVMRITGRAKITVYKWCSAKPNGTGGLIPSDIQQLLMAAALRGEVPLTPEDFFDLPAAE